MILKAKNPMNRALVGHLIMCDFICAGLAMIGAVLVDHRPMALTLAVGGTAMVLSLVSVALFRKPIGMWLGHLTQLVVLAMGFLTSTMFFLGGVFLLLWITMIVLGKRMEKVNPGKFDA